MDEEKVPVTKVLDDMYNPNGGLVSQAAREYYYKNYATDEEREAMDREDRMEYIIAIIFALMLLAGFVLAVVVTLI